MEPEEILILDYNCGNVGSVFNMVKKVGARPRIVTSPNEIKGSRKLIVPGVGSFDRGVEYLKQKELFNEVKVFAKNQDNLILGLCLGMQLLCDSSEEGVSEGFGFIPGRCIKLKASKTFKVPNMGWRDITATQSSKLLKGIESPRFYFVHSYHMVCDDIYSESKSSHNDLEFNCLVRNKNVMGAQFHPEKSHHYGQSLFSNFLKL